MAGRTGRATGGSPCRGGDHSGKVSANGQHDPAGLPDRRWETFFLEFWTKAGHNPAIWQATIAPYRRYRTFIAHMVEAGIAEGTLRDVDPETAAQALVSLAIGLLLQGLLDPQGADWGQEAEDSVRMFLEGLERRE